MRYKHILEACWKGYAQKGMKSKNGRMVPNCVPVSEQELEEDLRKWFKEKWVRFGPDGKIRGPCARGSSSEGKPKCLPQKKAHALGKKKRASAAARKRRQDPNPERSGKAKNVATESEYYSGSKSHSVPSKLQKLLDDWLLLNTQRDTALYFKKITKVGIINKQIDDLELKIKSFKNGKQELENFKNLYVNNKIKMQETHSTGTTIGSAGIGGGAGLGIEKSPFEKVLEKPLGELDSSGGGIRKPPKGPNKKNGPWDDDDNQPDDDFYKYPQPTSYRRSVDFFGKIEADHFDKEDFNDATGEFRGYWDYDGELKQIAYFKFNNPKRNGSDDPGMGWYYEPQN